MTDANAVRFFQDKLAYETSPREVVAAMQAGGDTITLLDIRRREAFDRGHLPGAISLPLEQIASAGTVLGTSGMVVVYDWGPASTASSRACLALAAQGFMVREMLGGYEYWLRLGLSVENSEGTLKRRASDPMVTTSEFGWD